MEILSLSKNNNQNEKQRWLSDFKLLHQQKIKIISKLPSIKKMSNFNPSKLINNAQNKGG